MTADWLFEAIHLEYEQRDGKITLCLFRHCSCSRRRRALGVNARVGERDQFCDTSYASLNLVRHFSRILVLASKFSSILIKFCTWHKATLALFSVLDYTRMYGSIRSPLFFSPTLGRHDTNKSFPIRPKTFIITFFQIRHEQGSCLHTYRIHKFT